jgi:hypothetical protein
MIHFMLSAKIRIIFELFVKRGKYCSMFNIKQSYWIPAKGTNSYIYSTHTHILDDSITYNQITPLTKS